VEGSKEEAAGAAVNTNRTTAVGLFPQGNSLQQVSDLAGNVWEWCLQRVPRREENWGSE